MAIPPALKALVAQLAGCAIAYGLARAGWLSAGLWPLVLAQACAAAACAAVLRSARWWLPMHLAFTPAAVLASRIDLAPAWYLGAFVVLLAIFWNSFRTQVPLYLSNRPTAEAVAGLFPADSSIRLLDIGSGTGSFVAAVAGMRPQWQVRGIETAPGPWLASRWRARTLGNTSVVRGDFFAATWSEFDVVYAFLSPVPMAAVWAKAKRELASGSMLISNSFPVPDRKPDQVVEVGDARSTRLFVYRLAPGEGGAN